MPRSCTRPAVRRSRTALTAVLALVLVGVPAPSASAVESVIPDPVGDVFDYRTEETGAFPPGDLVAFTVDLNAAHLRLGFELAAPGPVDATVQEDWLGATSLVAGIDLDGDGEDDRSVETYWEGDRAVTRVMDGDEIRCETAPGFAGAVITVVVDSGCVGGPESIAVQALAFWDVDPPGENLPDYVDAAPDATTATVPRSQPLPTDRLAGADRVGTAVEISRTQFPEGARAAYLAGSLAFADAVAAGSLVDGPILLVENCASNVADTVAAELDRLAPDRVVALGGPDVLCDEVLEAAAGEDREADRLAGRDRFDTALAISAERYDDADDEARSVYLARADDAADSVAAAGLEDGPVLLVPSCGELPDGVADEIERLEPDRVVALGSTGAVCDDLLDAVAPSGVETARLGGDSRFATAAALALDPAGGAAGTVYLADAFGLADAVAAGTLTDGPVLLVPRCGPVPDEVRRTIDVIAPQRVVALGGTAAICDDALLDAAA